jgi:predicted RNA binding protein YcfA (HicA-like mRNA interferase family)
VKQVSGRARSWKLARIHGSHHVFTMEGRRERLVIPIHGNRPLKSGLLRALMRIANLSEPDL